ncbi:hypothetical protein [Clavibacter michiganensis]|uniref:Uncharacterized protein n=1 Tax=Clavibacter michiganensis subsp. insidiosus TaxID=33014 RepID=A0A0D5CKJ6_9MICO|nr:hypothetical protein [Clavibacter michiganensis]AJW80166.1 hypothetical protein VO01_14500 [Clavibacter michiganensis subsp. insidiosus]AWF97166.1 hypothetical protein BEH61_01450 [Clavibacter michiganensis subsp. insidiosus]AWG02746.1 hypothetical protein BEH62_14220 [Clavibacter michiganensis subsp. insidiosus]OQJ58836.1 hypothetical protein B5P21_02150 [Clavibacter michiganensis subsp. insidiosus]RII86150.1 hypothetical protein DZF92_11630 [Clavibacter michiganensis subsp. insidiosus]
MSTTATPGPDRRRRAFIVLVVSALVAGVVMLAHSVVQGLGAYRFWTPCWVEGYESEICQRLQYEVVSPAWLAPLWVWAVEVALAVLVLVAASRAGGRVGFAVAALICVVASSVIVDYALTPLVNGGYMSADDPPGFGLIGAAAMAAGGALLLLALIPRRARAGAPSPA